MNKEELIQELTNLKAGHWTDKSADAIAAILDAYLDNHVLCILQNFRQLYADIRKEANNRENYIYYSGSLDAIDKVLKKLESE